ncbi:MAG: leucine--tRNA ligase [Candidatus Parcubacteria bacterium]|nr:MAG: leucine--tRNA ligase [Candidatus Parcubacteria bacterium]
MNYPHQKIETYWAKKWVQDKIYRAKDSSSKPKQYILDMFPYPSGEGLHVGHIEGYTASDILARYFRMKGYEVLHPIGWDAFGLPTENFAIKTKQDPHQVTQKNIAIFRSQCQRVGLSYDWDREINTADKDYYKWSQWLFLQLYKKGLAYKAKAPANWCTGCLTVLANEQVINGRCERCDSLVEIRNIEQWFFKITAYIDRLVKGLEKLDWPQRTKIGQINWIGESQGFEINFPLKDKKINLPVFTTRPETIPGVTFLAIAPEHPLLEEIVSDKQLIQVKNFLEKVKNKTLLERKTGEKKKEGIFSGSWAINPFNKKEIPVFVADYVLMDYATGVVMGVPAHDKRDFQFAKENNLPITYVFLPDSIKKPEDKPYPDEEGKMIVSPFKGMDLKTARQKIEAKLSKFGKKTTYFKLQDWLISRERYWGAPIPIIYCPKCGQVPVPEKDLPVLLPDDIKDFRPKGIPPLAQSKKFVNTQCPQCQGPAQRETKTLDTFVDSAWYFLRFPDPKNKKQFADPKKLKRWMPVDIYIGGAEHTVGHLLYSRFITKVLYDLKLIDFDEPFLKLRHQGMILGEDNRKMSKRWGNVIRPDEVAQKFGADTLRMYEMFMGPLEQSKPWSTRSLIGVRRLIERIWKLKDKVKTKVVKEDEKEKEITQKLIFNVTQYLEKEKFNLCVSEFMKYVNQAEELSALSKKWWEKFVLVLAPFAPFLAEELWKQLKNKYSVHQQKWPQIEEKIKEEILKIVVQVNGKLRGVLQLPSNKSYSDQEILKVAQNDPKISSKIKDLKIKKVIYVPRKVINLVV